MSLLKWALFFFVLAAIAGSVRVHRARVGRRRHRQGFVFPVPGRLRGDWHPRRHCFPGGHLIDRSGMLIRPEDAGGGPRTNAGLDFGIFVGIRQRCRIELPIVGNPRRDCFDVCEKSVILDNRIFDRRVRRGWAGTPKSLDLSNIRRRRPNGMLRRY